MARNNPTRTVRRTLTEREMREAADSIRATEFERAELLRQAQRGDIGAQFALRAVWLRNAKRKAPLPTYTDTIRMIAPPDKYDPRHIEAYIRLEHSTLDGLSAAQFRAEVSIAQACIDEAGAISAERLAQSFGL